MYHIAKRKICIKITAVNKWVILVCNIPLQISFPAAHLGFKISKPLAPQPPPCFICQLPLSYMNSNCKTQFSKRKWWQDKMLSIIPERILQINFENMLHKPHLLAFQLLKIKLNLPWNIRPLRMEHRVSVCSFLMQNRYGYHWKA